MQKAKEGLLVVNSVKDLVLEELFSVRSNRQEPSEGAKTNLASGQVCFEKALQKDDI